MPIEVLMPALSPTMTDGTLVRWLKKEGDEVKSGEVIAEIETDKATMEVEAVDEGTLGKILVEAGTQNVKVNEPIALLLEEDEDASALEGGAGAREGGQASAPPAQETASSKTTEKASAFSSAFAHKGEEEASIDTPLGRIAITPLARRLAEESSLDVMKLTGTGPRGRIVVADVEAALARGGASQASTQSRSRFASIGPSTLSAPRSVSSQTPVAANNETAPSVPASSGMDVRTYAEKLGMAYEAVPNSGVRKVIARRLTESKQQLPHFYLTVDCEIDGILALRKGLMKAQEVKVSVNDCVIRAVALALRKVPMANSSWTDEATFLYRDVDVSVAVDSPSGLVTPILKKADEKSLVALSAEMKTLASRAREGRLRPEEFQGGGFTISNLGMFGVKSFSAIVNPPQTCILAVGAGEQRPVVKDGQLAVATVMTCTLSVDHRAVDGSVGASFLAAFKGLIENPFSLVG